LRDPRIGMEDGAIILRAALAACPALHLLADCPGCLEARQAIG